MADPYFSIVLPTYNRSHMLGKALESVIGQTYSHWELIIVDDGSTDNTKEVVESYNDTRIRYFFQTNQERSAARNNGVEKAIGKYICFLDSDDYFLEDRLERIYHSIQELKEPSAFMFTGVSFDKNGSVTKRAEKHLSDFHNKYDFFMFSHVHCQQTIISKEILLQNKFNIHFNITEDTELWMRIISSHDFIFIEDQQTVVVADHEDRSVNVSKYNAYSKVMEVFSYMRKEFNYPFSKKIVKYVKTDGNFGIARHYIYNEKRLLAAKYLILSILYNLRHRQLKYRLHVLVTVFINIKKSKSLIT
jgi:glycosyltransferase involved in cell wall biosynthesis